MTLAVPRRRRKQISWAVIAVSAIGIAVYSAPAYLTGDTSLSRIPINPDIAVHYLSIVVHALPACLVLFIGPFQFAATLRARRPALHRILGRVYMISMVIASIAAIAAATFTTSGFSVQVAFYLLTAAWLYSLAMGFRSIRQGQVQLHRIWMIRNYALTFAAVVLRVFLGIGLLLQAGPFPWLSFDDIYPASVWASIVVCAVYAEYFIIQKTLTPLLRRRERGPEAPVRAASTP
ncbi:DUF2306 domain-containing protein [Streptomyces sp. NBC_01262]|uniref:DUF2306 domain-containing protein n=1 Tax=Streptomyces sp. NBC_01262 TaxID=2903803 RepID=UPI002E31E0C4|nr:DUF2306 domain-containing protein [Streptomyces sp. NBC_01262]